jgi:hypothetical protein
MRHLPSDSRRHPSAILFLVQLLGVLLYPSTRRVARAIASLEMMVGVMYLAGVVTRLISFTTQARE